MKEFWWNCFLNNYLMCSFVMEGWIFLMTIFLLSLWERSFSQWLPGQMCCISCSKISVSFSEPVWIAVPPLGRVYVCFILIFFQERSLIYFFIFAELFGFISWGIFCLHLFLHLTFAVLQKPCQQNFGKFQEFGESRFGGSEKDCYFLKILKW